MSQLDHEWELPRNPCPGLPRPRWICKLCGVRADEYYRPDTYDHPSVSPVCSVKVQQAQQGGKVEK